MVVKTEPEPEDQIRSHVDQYRRKLSTNFPGHEKFPNGAKVVDQAKLPDEANIPDLRPLRHRKMQPECCHLGLGIRLILIIPGWLRAETSVLDGFCRLRLPSMAPKSVQKERYEYPALRNPVVCRTNVPLRKLRSIIIHRSHSNLIRLIATTVGCQVTLQR